MQGLQYYSTWNFGCWVAAEAGVLKLNGPLRTSIIATSILGGYMTYIYPRKITYYEKGEKKVVPRRLAILLDIIGHQLPMYRIYYHLHSNQVNRAFVEYIRYYPHLYMLLLTTVVVKHSQIFMESLPINYILLVLS